MCVHLSFRPTIVSPHQALIEAVSIAIWNKNKIAVALAIGTWAINVAFLIQGMLFPLRPVASCVVTQTRFFFVTGPVRVSHGSVNIDYLWVFLTFQLIRRCALFGYRPDSTAELSILRATNSPSCPWQLPTSFYFLPCSLACFACVVTVVVLLV